MQKFKRIDRKLLFYFLTITILLLGIGTFIAYNRGVTTTRKQTLDHLRRTAIALKGHVNTFIKSQKNIARDFSSDRMIIQSLSKLNGNLSDVETQMIIERLNRHLLFNKLSLYSPNILAISLLNHKGTVVFSTDETKIGKDESEKEYFSMVKKDGYFGKLHYSETFYEPVYEVSAPVVEKETGVFLGVLVNIFSGSTLANITRSNWLEEFESVSADSAIGSYLYGTPQARGSKQFVKQRDGSASQDVYLQDVYIVNSDKKMITLSRFAEDSVLKQDVDTEPVRRALANGEEMVGIYKNYKGSLIIGISIFINELKWVILAEKDISETFAPIFRLKAQLITFMIASILIVIIISSYVAKKISVPVKRLIDAIQIRSEGDFDYRISEISNDEFGALTVSFNKMCDDIRNETVSKEYMEKVFNGISESLIITDMNFNIKKVNRAALNILDYEENELVGRSIHTIFESDLPFIDRVGLQELIKHDYILNNPDLKYKGKNGEIIPVKLSASVIRDCKHKKHPKDCRNYKRNQICSVCNSINIVVVASDLRVMRALIQKEKERIFELTTIQEISRQLGHTLNYDDLFRLILDPLHTAINFDIAGSVFCGDPGDLIYIRQTQFIDDKLMAWFKENLMKTFIKLTGNEHKGCKREVINITGAITKGIGSGNNEVRSYFNVPLIVKEKIVGLINISSFKENAFEANHIRTLYTVANQVTVSIQHLISLVEHEKGKLTSILRDMIDGVIMVNSKGVIDMVNPAGEKMLKILSISRQGETIVHLGDYHLKEPMRMILNNEKQYISEKLSFTKNAEQMTVSIVIAPIKGETHNVGVVIVLRDVTNEYNIQQQLLHAERLSTIGEMVSGIAHEINNPLAGIMGLSQLLQIQSDLPGSVRKNIDKIFSYTERARKIIQNLLTFARSHKPEKILVNINKLLEQAIEMHEYNMKISNIEIIKEMDPDLPEIVADMYQLQQVFFNIINNACQAMLEYSGERKFTLKTMKDGENIRISFHNTGHRIPEDIIKKIFNPFFTTKEVGKGTGMGLSISYGIIKEHDGDIYATSKINEGVTFYVTLPLKSKSTLEKEIKTAGDGKKEAIHIRSKKILIVDDETAIADSISALLTADGHICDVALMVNDAIKKLAAYNYDLIISDIKMPGLDGKEFFAYLKLKMPVLTNRFIVITGDVMNSETRSFIEDNNIHFITKPFTFYELKKTIAEVSEEV